MKMNKIKVVYGAPDVPYMAVGEVLENILADVGYRESDTVQRDDIDYEVVNKEGSGIPILRGDHMLEVIACLHDHIANVNPEDWIDHYMDTMVDEDEGLWVSVGKGIYYGPDCVVEVYYVTI